VNSHLTSKIDATKLRTMRSGLKGRAKGGRYFWDASPEHKAKVTEYHREQSRVDSAAYRKRQAENLRKARGVAGALMSMRARQVQRAWHHKRDGVELVADRLREFLSPNEVMALLAELNGGTLS
jgi:hypothetical protein